MKLVQTDTVKTKEGRTGQISRIHKSMNGRVVVATVCMHDTCQWENHFLFTLKKIKTPIPGERSSVPF